MLQFTNNNILEIKRTNLRFDISELKQFDINWFKNNFNIDTGDWSTLDDWDNSDNYIIKYKNSNNNWEDLSYNEHPPNTYNMLQFTYKILEIKRTEFKISIPNPQEKNFILQKKNLIIKNDINYREIYNDMSNNKPNFSKNIVNNQIIYTPSNNHVDYQLVDQDNNFLQIKNLFQSTFDNSINAHDITNPNDTFDMKYVILYPSIKHIQFNPNNNDYSDTILTQYRLDSFKDQDYDDYELKYSENTRDWNDTNINNNIYVKFIKYYNFNLNNIRTLSIDKLKSLTPIISNDKDYNELSRIMFEGAVITYSQSKIYTETHSNILDTNAKNNRYIFVKHNYSFFILDSGKEFLIKLNKPTIKYGDSENLINNELNYSNIELELYNYTSLNNKYANIKLRYKNSGSQIFDLLKYVINNLDSTIKSNSEGIDKRFNNYNRNDSYVNINLNEYINYEFYLIKKNNLYNITYKPIFNTINDVRVNYNKLTQIKYEGAPFLDKLEYLRTYTKNELTKLSYDDIIRIFNYVLSLNSCFSNNRFTDDFKLSFDINDNYTYNDIDYAINFTGLTIDDISNYLNNPILQISPNHPDTFKDILVSKTKLELIKLFENETEHTIENYLNLNTQNLSFNEMQNIFRNDISKTTIFQDLKNIINNRPKNQFDVSFGINSHHSYSEIVNMLNMGYTKEELKLNIINDDNEFKDYYYKDISYQENDDNKIQMQYEDYLNIYRKRYKLSDFTSDISYLKKILYNIDTSSNFNNDFDIISDQKTYNDVIDLVYNRFNEERLISDISNKELHNHFTTIASEPNDWSNNLYFDYNYYFNKQQFYDTFISKTISDYNLANSYLKLSNCEDIIITISNDIFNDRYMTYTLFKSALSLYPNIDYFVLDTSNNYESLGDKSDISCKYIKIITPNSIADTENDLLYGTQNYYKDRFQQINNDKLLKLLKVNNGNVLSWNDESWQETDFSLNYTDIINKSSNINWWLNRYNIEFSYLSNTNDDINIQTILGWDISEYEASSQRLYGLKFKYVLDNHYNTIKDGRFIDISQIIHDINGINYVTENVILSHSVIMDQSNNYNHWENNFNILYSSYLKFNYNDFIDMNYNDFSNNFNIDRNKINDLSGILKIKPYDNSYGNWNNSGWVSGDISLTYTNINNSLDDISFFKNRFIIKNAFRSISGNIWNKITTFENNYINYYDISYDGNLGNIHDLSGILRVKPHNSFGSWDNSSWAISDSDIIDNSLNQNWWEERFKIIDQSNVGFNWYELINLKKDEWSVDEDFTVLNGDINDLSGALRINQKDNKNSWENLIWDNSDISLNYNNIIDNSNNNDWWFSRFDIKNSFFNYNWSNLLSLSKEYWDNFDISKNGNNNEVNDLSGTLRVKSIYDENSSWDNSGWVIVYNDILDNSKNENWWKDRFEILKINNYYNLYNLLDNSGDFWRGFDISMDNGDGTYSNMDYNDLSGILRLHSSDISWDNTKWSLSDVCLNQTNILIDNSQNANWWKERFHVLINNIDKTNTTGYKLNYESLMKRSNQFWDFFDISYDGNFRNINDLSGIFRVKPYSLDSSWDNSGWVITYKDIFDNSKNTNWWRERYDILAFNGITESYQSLMDKDISFWDYFDITEYDSSNNETKPASVNDLSGILRCNSGSSVNSWHNEKWNYSISGISEIKDNSNNLNWFNERYDVIFSDNVLTNMHEILNLSYGNLSNNYIMETKYGLINDLSGILRVKPGGDTNGSWDNSGWVIKYNDIIDNSNNINWFNDRFNIYTSENNTSYYDILNMNYNELNDYFFINTHQSEISTINDLSYILRVTPSGHTLGNWHNSGWVITYQDIIDNSNNLNWFNDRFNILDKKGLLYNWSDLTSAGSDFWERFDISIDNVSKTYNDLSGILRVKPSGNTNGSWDNSGWVIKYNDIIDNSDNVNWFNDRFNIYTSENNTSYYDILNMNYNELNDYFFINTHQSEISTINDLSYILRVTPSGHTLGNWHNSGWVITYQDIIDNSNNLNWFNDRFNILDKKGLLYNWSDLTSAGSDFWERFDISIDNVSKTYNDLSGILRVKPHGDTNGSWGYSHWTANDISLNYNNIIDNSNNNDWWSNRFDIKYSYYNYNVFDLFDMSKNFWNNFDICGEGNIDDISSLLRFTPSSDTFGNWDNSRWLIKHNDIIDNSDNVNWFTDRFNIDEICGNIIYNFDELLELKSDFWDLCDMSLNNETSITSEYMKNFLREGGDWNNSINTFQPIITYNTIIDNSRNHTWWEKEYDIKTQKTELMLNSYMMLNADNGYFNNFEILTESKTITDLSNILRDNDEKYVDYSLNKTNIINNWWENKFDFIDNNIFLNWYDIFDSSKNFWDQNYDITLNGSDINANDLSGILRVINFGETRGNWDSKYINHSITYRYIIDNSKNILFFNHYYTRVYADYIFNLDYLLNKTDWWQNNFEIVAPTGNWNSEHIDSIGKLGVIFKSILDTSLTTINCQRQDIVKVINDETILENDKFTKKYTTPGLLSNWYNLMNIEKTTWNNYVLSFQDSILEKLRIDNNINNNSDNNKWHSTILNRNDFINAIYKNDENWFNYRYRIVEPIPISEHEVIQDITFNDIKSIISKTDLNITTSYNINDRRNNLLGDVYILTDSNTTERYIDIYDGSIKVIIQSKAPLIYVTNHDEDYKPSYKNICFNGYSENSDPMHFKYINIVSYDFNGFDLLYRRSVRLSPDSNIDNHDLEESKKGDYNQRTFDILYLNHNVVILNFRLNQGSVQYLIDYVDSAENQIYMNWKWPVIRAGHPVPWINSHFDTLYLLLYELNNNRNYGNNIHDGQHIDWESEEWGYWGLGTVVHNIEIQRPQYLWSEHGRYWTKTYMNMRKVTGKGEFYSSLTINNDNASVNLWNLTKLKDIDYNIVTSNTYDLMSTNFNGNDNDIFTMKKNNFDNIFELIFNVSTVKYSNSSNNNLNRGKYMTDTYNHPDDSVSKPFIDEYYNDSTNSTRRRALTRNEKRKLYRLPLDWSDSSGNVFHHLHGYYPWVESVDDDLWGNDSNAYNNYGFSNSDIISQNENIIRTYKNNRLYSQNKNIKYLFTYTKAPLGLYVGELSIFKYKTHKLLDSKLLLNDNDILQNYISINYSSFSIILKNNFLSEVSLDNQTYIPLKESGNIGDYIRFTNHVNDNESVTIKAKNAFYENITTNFTEIYTNNILEHQLKLENKMSESNSDSNEYILLNYIRNDLTEKIIYKKKLPDVFISKTSGSDKIDIKTLSRDKISEKKIANYIEIEKEEKTIILKYKDTNLFKKETLLNLLKNIDNIDIYTNNNYNNIFENKYDDSRGNIYFAFKDIYKELVLKRKMPTLKFGEELTNLTDDQNYHNDQNRIKTKYIQIDNEGDIINLKVKDVTMLIQALQNIENCNIFTSDNKFKTPYLNVYDILNFRLQTIIPPTYKLLKDAWNEFVFYPNHPTAPASIERDLKKKFYVKQKNRYKFNKHNILSDDPLWKESYYNTKFKIENITEFTIYKKTGHDRIKYPSNIQDDDIIESFKIDGPLGEDRGTFINDLDEHFNFIPEKSNFTNIGTQFKKIWSKEPLNEYYSLGETADDSDISMGLQDTKQNYDIYDILASNYFTGEYSNYYDNQTQLMENIVTNMPNFHESLPQFKYLFTDLWQHFLGGHSISKYSKFRIEIRLKADIGDWILLFEKFKDTPVYTQQLVRELYNYSHIKDSNYYNVEELKITIDNTGLIDRHNQPEEVSKQYTSGVFVFKSKNLMGDKIQDTQTLKKYTRFLVYNSPIHALANNNIDIKRNQNLTVHVGKTKVHNYNYLNQLEEDKKHFKFFDISYNNNLISCKFKDNTEQARNHLLLNHINNRKIIINYINNKQYINLESYTTCPTTNWAGPWSFDLNPAPSIFYGIYLPNTILSSKEPNIYFSVNEINDINLGDQLGHIPSNFKYIKIKSNITDQSLVLVNNDLKLLESITKKLNTSYFKTSNNYIDYNLSEDIIDITSDNQNRTKLYIDITHKSQKIILKNKAPIIHVINNGNRINMGTSNDEMQPGYEKTIFDSIEISFNDKRISINPTDNAYLKNIIDNINVIDTSFVNVTSYDNTEITRIINNLNPFNNLDKYVRIMNKHNSDTNNYNQGIILQLKTPIISFKTSDDTEWIEDTNSSYYKDYNFIKIKINNIILDISGNNILTEMLQDYDKLENGIQPNSTQVIDSDKTIERYLKFTKSNKTLIIISKAPVIYAINNENTIIMGTSNDEMQPGYEKNIFDSIEISFDDKHISINPTNDAHLKNIIDNINVIDTSFVNVNSYNNNENTRIINNLNPFNNLDKYVRIMNKHNSDTNNYNQGIILQLKTPIISFKTSDDTEWIEDTNSSYYKDYNFIKIKINNIILDISGNNILTEMLQDYDKLENGIQPNSTQVIDSDKTIERYLKFTKSNKTLTIKSKAPKIKYGFDSNTRSEFGSFQHDDTKQKYSYLKISSNYNDYTIKYNTDSILNNILSNLHDYNIYSCNIDNYNRWKDPSASSEIKNFSSPEGNQRQLYFNLWKKNENSIQSTGDHDIYDRIIIFNIGQNNTVLQSKAPYIKYKTYYRYDMEVRSMIENTDYVDTLNQIIELTITNYNYDQSFNLKLDYHKLLTNLYLSNTNTQIKSSSSKQLNNDSVRILGDKPLNDIWTGLQSFNINPEKEFNLTNYTESQAKIKLPNILRVYDENFNIIWLRSKAPLIENLDISINTDSPLTISDSSYILDIIDISISDFDSNFKDKKIQLIPKDISYINLINTLIEGDVSIKTTDDITSYQNDIDTNTDNNGTFNNIWKESITLNDNTERYISISGSNNHILIINRIPDISISIDDPGKTTYPNGYDTSYAIKRLKDISSNFEYLKIKDMVNKRSYTLKSNIKTVVNNITNYNIKTSNDCSNDDITLINDSKILSESYQNNRVKKYIDISNLNKRIFLKSKAPEIYVSMDPINIYNNGHLLNDTSLNFKYVKIYNSITDASYDLSINYFTGLDSILSKLNESYIKTSNDYLDNSINLSENIIDIKSDDVNKTQRYIDISNVSHKTILKNKAPKIYISNNNINFNNKGENIQYLGFENDANRTNFKYINIKDYNDNSLIDLSYNYFNNITHLLEYNDISFITGNDINQINNNISNIYVDRYLDISNLNKKIRLKNKAPEIYLINEEDNRTKFEINDNSNIIYKSIDISFNNKIYNLKLNFNALRLLNDISINTSNNYSDTYILPNKITVNEDNVNKTYDYIDISDLNYKFIIKNKAPKIYVSSSPITETNPGNLISFSNSYPHFDASYVRITSETDTIDLSYNAYKLLTYILKQDNCLIDTSDNYSDNDKIINGININSTQQSLRLKTYTQISGDDHKIILRNKLPIIRYSINEFSHSNEGDIMSDTSVKNYNYISINNHNESKRYIFNYIDYNKIAQILSNTPSIKSSNNYTNNNNYLTGINITNVNLNKTKKYIEISNNDGLNTIILGSKRPYFYVKLNSDSNYNPLTNDISFNHIIIENLDLSVNMIVKPDLSNQWVKIYADLKNTFDILSSETRDGDYSDITEKNQKYIKIERSRYDLSNNGISEKSQEDNIKENNRILENFNLKSKFLDSSDISISSSNSLITENETSFNESFNTDISFTKKYIFILDKTQQPSIVYSLEAKKNYVPEIYTNDNSSNFGLNDVMYGTMKSLRYTQISGMIDNIIINKKDPIIKFYYDADDTLHTEGYLEKPAYIYFNLSDNIDNTNNSFTLENKFNPNVKVYYNLNEKKTEAHDNSYVFNNFEIESKKGKVKISGKLKTDGSNYVNNSYDVFTNNISSNYRYVDNSKNFLLKYVKIKLKTDNNVSTTLEIEPIINDSSFTLYTSESLNNLSDTYTRLNNKDNSNSNILNYCRLKIYTNSDILRYNDFNDTYENIPKEFTFKYNNYYHRYLYNNLKKPNILIKTSNSKDDFNILTNNKYVDKYIKFNNDNIIFKKIYDQAQIYNISGNDKIEVLNDISFMFDYNEFKTKLSDLSNNIIKYGEFVKTYDLVNDFGEKHYLKQISEMKTKNYNNISIYSSNNIYELRNNNNKLSNDNNLKTKLYILVKDNNDNFEYIIKNTKIYISDIFEISFNNTTFNKDIRVTLDNLYSRGLDFWRKYYKIYSDHTYSFLMSILKKPGEGNQFWTKDDNNKPIITYGARNTELTETLNTLPKILKITDKTINQTIKLKKIDTEIIDTRFIEVFVDPMNNGNLSKKLHFEYGLDRNSLIKDWDQHRSNFTMINNPNIELDDIESDFLSKSIIRVYDTEQQIKDDNDNSSGYELDNDKIKLNYIKIYNDGTTSINSELFKDIWTQRHKNYEDRYNVTFQDRLDLLGFTILDLKTRLYSEVLINGDFDEIFEKLQLPIDNNIDNNTPYWKDKKSPVDEETLNDYFRSKGINNSEEEDMSSISKIIANDSIVKFLNNNQEWVVLNRSSDDSSIFMDTDEKRYYEYLYTYDAENSANTGIWKITLTSNKVRHTSKIYDNFNNDMIEFEFCYCKYAGKYQEYQEYKGSYALYNFGNNINVNLDIYAVEVNNHGRHYGFYKIDKLFKYVLVSNNIKHIYSIKDSLLTNKQLWRIMPDDTLKIELKLLDRKNFESLDFNWIVFIEDSTYRYIKREGLTIDLSLNSIDINLDNIYNVRFSNLKPKLEIFKPISYLPEIEKIEVLISFNDINDNIETLNQDLDIQISNLYLLLDNNNNYHLSKTDYKINNKYCYYFNNYSNYLNGNTSNNIIYIAFNIDIVNFNKNNIYYKNNEINIPNNIIDTLDIKRNINNNFKIYNNGIIKDISFPYNIASEYTYYGYSDYSENDILLIKIGNLDNFNYYNKLDLTNIDVNINNGDKLNSINSNLESFVYDINYNENYLISKINDFSKIYSASDKLEIHTSKLVSHPKTDIYSDMSLNKFEIDDFDEIIPNFEFDNLIINKSEDLDILLEHEGIPRENISGIEVYTKYNYLNNLPYSIIYNKDEIINGKFEYDNFKCDKDTIFNIITHNHNSINNNKFKIEDYNNFIKKNFNGLLRKQIIESKPIINSDIILNKSDNDIHNDFEIDFDKDSDIPDNIKKEFEKEKSYFIKNNFSYNTFTNDELKDIPLWDYEIFKYNFNILYSNIGAYNYYTIFSELKDVITYYSDDLIFYTSHNYNDLNNSNNRILIENQIYSKKYIRIQYQNDIIDIESITSNQVLPNFTYNKILSLDYDEFTNIFISVNNFINKSTWNTIQNGTPQIRTYYNNDNSINLRSNVNIFARTYIDISHNNNYYVYKFRPDIETKKSYDDSWNSIYIDSSNINLSNLRSYNIESLKNQFVILAPNEGRYKMLKLLINKLDIHTGETIHTINTKLTDNNKLDLYSQVGNLTFIKSTINNHLRLKIFDTTYRDDYNIDNILTYNYSKLLNQFDISITHFSNDVSDKNRNLYNILQLTDDNKYFKKTDDSLIYDINKPIFQNFIDISISNAITYDTKNEITIDDLQKKTTVSGNTYFGMNFFDFINQTNNYANHRFTRINIPYTIINPDDLVNNWGSHKLYFQTLYGSPRPTAEEMSGIIRKYHTQYDMINDTAKDETERNGFSLDICSNNIIDFFSVQTNDRVIELKRSNFDPPFNIDISKHFWNQDNRDNLKSLSSIPNIYTGDTEDNVNESLINDIPFINWDTIKDNSQNEQEFFDKYYLRYEKHKNGTNEIFSTILTNLNNASLKLYLNKDNNFEILSDDDIMKINFNDLKLLERNDDNKYLYRDFILKSNNSIFYFKLKLKQNLTLNQLRDKNIDYFNTYWKILPGSLTFNMQELKENINDEIVTGNDINDLNTSMTITNIVPTQKYIKVNDIIAQQNFDNITTKKYIRFDLSENFILRDNESYGEIKKKLYDNKYNTKHNYNDDPKDTINNNDKFKKNIEITK